MTIKAHGAVGLSTCFLSFVVLGGFLCQVVEYDRLRDWLWASVTGIVACFAINVHRQGREDLARSQDAAIDNSTFDKMCDLGIIWVPPILAALAVFAVYRLHASVSQVGWILTAIGCDLGARFARIFLSPEADPPA